MIPETKVRVVGLREGSVIVEVVLDAAIGDAAGVSALEVPLP